ncbi:hypothetical protein [Streptomyces chartreusis]
MTQEPEPSGDRLARLTEVGRQILAEIKVLTDEDIGEQFVSLAKLGRTNRRMIWALIISFVLTLTMVGGWGLALTRIDNLTQRLDVAQTDTRAKAWCPLYTLLLESESPEARAAAEDPEAYDHAFDVIRDGYDALHCADFTDAPPPFTKNPKG